jgi:ABC-type oligopeptide transport system substrate-binding subunit/class 3 adenylate cyclase
VSDEYRQLEEAIAAIEAERAVLGDSVVEAALDPMRAKLASLAPAPRLPEERKLVTVMFADISGFTAMVERMDPEEARDLVNACFDRLVPTIERYEGTVDKFIGDEIMALFGAPMAHEDDPERALRAALEMMDALSTFNAERKMDLGIHFGINTGLVVTGGIGTRSSRSYSVIGDAVNLASRLEEISERGDVLVGPDTYRLAAHQFEFEALDPVRVKGRTQPVQVYRVLSLKAVPDSQRGIAGLASPLVGRDPEFSALQGAVDRLRMNEGGVVTIVGDAGLGKSRLVAEAREAAEAESVRWVEGRCLSHSASIAYSLWLDILRELLDLPQKALGAGLGDTLRERVLSVCPRDCDKAYPLLARLMSVPMGDDASAALSALEGEDLKEQTFGAVENLLGGMVEQSTLVIVCEDLHWADPTSIELLERLLALTVRAPVLFVCVLRPDVLHPCWRIRQVAADVCGDRYLDLYLDPLSASAAETLVGNLLGVRGLSPGLKHRILERAEGNPFYVEEVTRFLIAEKVIVWDEATGCWRATQSDADIAIPDTLHGVLMTRIDRLQERAKRILQMASVIGRIFAYRVLAYVVEQEGGVAGRGPKDLDTPLLNLQQQGMIRERTRLPELEYIFKHHLFQEAAYDGLLMRERSVIHRWVAEALERLFPEQIEEYVGLLSRHWLLAKEERRAIPYLLKSGDQARALYAHTEAEQYYRQAVDILQQQGRNELAARTLMKLGLVYTAAFRPDMARDAYDRAFSLWAPLRATAFELRVPAAITTLRFAVGEPLTLDPGKMNDDLSVLMAAQLFDGLVRVDPDRNVLPAAAARWEVSDGGKRYVFRLQAGLCWNDGTLLSANDFEYAWKRNLAPATEAPMAHLLYVIQNARAFHEAEIVDPSRVGVRALDPQTLEVLLERPTAYLPHLLAHPIAYPLPRWTIEEHGAAWAEPGNMVSNGAYELVEWDRGRRVSLRRSLLYRGRFTGNIDRVNCPLFTDFEPVLESYAADAVDAVSMITADPSTIARAQALYGRDLVVIPLLSTLFLIFRTDQRPFDDVRVRQAFVLSVNKQAMADEALQGGQLARGGVVPPGMAGHSPDIGLAYDPNRARRLLAEAGYPGGWDFPVVSWVCPGGATDQGVVPFLQGAWRDALGLELEARSLEWREFVAQLSGDPANLIMAGWTADYPDPDSLLRIVFHSSEGLNYPRWSNLTFDHLVQEAAKITDHDKRMDLYREADRILVAEEAAVLPLSYPQRRMLVKPWVTLPQIPPAWMPIKDIVLRRR